MNSLPRFLSFSCLILLLSHVSTLRADDWPQWRGPDRDGVWHEAGIMETFPAERIKPRWTASVGIGFSSPVIADGRVFVTDTVHGKPPHADERVHAFDAKTGEPLWTHTYAVEYRESFFSEAFRTGPISTPVVNDGRVYTSGASGVVVCLDAVKGDVLWQRNLQQDFPESEVIGSTSLLIEGDLVILMPCAKPNATVLALDKQTGKTVWTALEEAETASSAIAITDGGVRQIIVWTSESVTSLEPATGKTLWAERLFTTKDATVSTPVYRDGQLLIGGLMMQMKQEPPSAVTLWPKSRATARRVFSDTSTAAFRGDYVYSARSFGEFICVDAKTGEVKWETDKVTTQLSGASVHITTHGETDLLYNNDGELIRARLAPDGYHELSRTKILDPGVTYSGRKVAWSAPAFAHRCIYARTNTQLVCISLAVE
ncbi:MAG: PQQ-binding-like beta-propeller repeat protein [Planctomycetaceae bacterium]